MHTHSHICTHRDLKTANVFLTKEGNVKLGDFGISKVLTATNQEANTVLGTPYYISPEIVSHTPRSLFSSLKQADTYINTHANVHAYTQ